MKFSKLFLVFFSIFLVVSCSDNNDDTIQPKPIPLGAYAKGVFILNEGSSGQGGVSYLSDDFSVFKKDIYTDVNSGDLIGKFVQSMFFSTDKTYIIAGGSNVINVVDRLTFKLIAKIETGLKNPRYGVTLNGKAYVTNANTYYDKSNPNGNTDDYIAVIDLATNTFESKIELNATANRIVSENNKLYVTEPYNNTKVLVVNPIIKALENPIEIGISADTMETKNGVLYVMQGGYPGKLSKIKLSDKTITAINFPMALDGSSNLDIYENKIYYTVGTAVYAMDINATESSTTPVFTYTSTSEFGVMYGFAVNKNHIFVADGEDFKSSGKAYVYSLSGKLEKEFATGVGPNGFYFNE
jgi:hypothetical protein